MFISFLNTSEVISIHERLTIDAKNSDDPISPSGIKNKGLLESAVSRQEAGFGGTLKYDNPISNAATLCYGICCNHTFHNGNKRTALVSLFSHLDKNNLTFNNKTNQKELYSFMLKIASHTLVPEKKKRKIKDLSDAEVEYMHRWINRRTRKIQKGERMLTYQKLERLLRGFDVHFENQNGNYVDVIKYETIVVRKGLFGMKKNKERTSKKIANIPFFPGRTVGKGLIKSIRQKANLTHVDGIDSKLFYGDEKTPDDFIFQYKGLLNKLAKT